MYPSCPLTFIQRLQQRTVSILPKNGGRQVISMQQAPRTTPQTSGVGRNSFGGTIPLPFLPGSRQTIPGLPIATPQNGPIVDYNVTEQ